MDAYAISFSSLSERTTSRIWRDLKSYHHCSIVELDAEEMAEPISLEARIGKVYPAEALRLQLVGEVLVVTVCG